MLSPESPDHSWFSLTLWHLN